MCRCTRWGRHGTSIIAWTHSGNRNLIRGLVLAGSFAVPPSVRVLVFKCNVRRNVSLHQVMRLLLGGVLALLFSPFVYRLGAAFPIQWLGASIAGLLEQPAKLLTLAIVSNGRRCHYTLNG